MPGPKMSLTARLSALSPGPWRPPSVAHCEGPVTMSVYLEDQHENGLLLMLGDHDPQCIGGETEAHRGDGICTNHMAH